MASEKILVVNGRILMPSGTIKRGYLEAVNGKISAVGIGEPSRIGEEEVIDAKGHLVLPGFIDIHVNGGGGHMSTEGSTEAVRAMAAAHARHGTTSMVVTTISADFAVLEQTMQAIAEVSENGSGGAEVLGVHLEGPFISPEKAGAHKKAYLKNPSIDAFDDLFEAARERIRLLSLAPELDGAIELIRHACEKGVVVALAHSNADYDTTVEALKAGLRICAHLFNSMPPLAHRSPGPIGAFLTSPDAYVELISDGYHVHPAVMEIAIRAKGTDRVILVTDAVSPAGTDMRSFSIDGIALEVRGNSCFTKDGHLAGSALTMDEAVKVVAERTSFSLENAVAMASITAATALGLDAHKGSLKVGKDADFIITTDDLRVLRTVVGGRSVYEQ